MLTAGAGVAVLAAATAECAVGVGVGLDGRPRIIAAKIKSVHPAIARPTTSCAVLRRPLPSTLRAGGRSVDEE